MTGWEGICGCAGRWSIDSHTRRSIHAHTLPQVDNWDLVEQIWAHANRAYLKVDLAQTPLLLVERAFNTPK